MFQSVSDVADAGLYAGLDVELVGEALFGMTEQDFEEFLQVLTVDFSKEDNNG